MSAKRAREVRAQDAKLAATLSRMLQANPREWPTLLRIAAAWRKHYARIRNRPEWSFPPITPLPSPMRKSKLSPIPWRSPTL